MKNKWLNKLLAAMMVSALSVGVLAGCGQSDDADNSVASEKEESKSEVSQESKEEVKEEVPEELTYPLNTEVKLSYWLNPNLGASLSTTYMDAADSPFHSGLEERTGVDIEWQWPAQGAELATAYNLVLQEDELPNMISHAVTTSQANELYEDGLIYDLTEYLPEYAPDFWEYLNGLESPDLMNMLKNDDGKILMIPHLREGNYNVTYRGPVIRQDWLDECGLEAPVTLEDWENVLIAFKEKYDAVLSFTRGRFGPGGIASGTGAQATLTTRYYVDENNKVQCAVAEEEWLEMLNVLKRWYEMDLLDKDFNTIDDATVRAKVLNNEVGVSFTALSQLTNWIVDANANETGSDWVGFSYPRTAEGEPTCFIDTTRCIYWAGNGGTMITTSSSEEELILALQFLNYGYTEEGMIYWNYGEEGVSYALDEAGEVKWTELIANDPDGKAEAIKKYAGEHSSGASVQLEKMVQIKNEESSADAVWAWVENTEAPKYCLPALPYTAEEQQTYSDINSAITTYVEEMSAKYILGEKSDLEDFDAFVETLNKMKLQECIDVQQAAFDRYLAK